MSALLISEQGQAVSGADTGEMTAHHHPPKAPRASLFDRLDPRSRVIGTILFALVVVTAERFAGLGLALGLSVMAAVVARLNFGRTVRRLLALEGFMAIVLLMLPFTMPGKEVFAIGGLAASVEGFSRAVVIAVKANAVMLMVLALISPLDIAAFGRALTGMRLPDNLVRLFLFTVRYLSVLQDEYERLRLAMRARAFVMRTNFHTWRSVGHLFGMMIVRSIERSERIVAAMRCRGFDGRFPVFDAAHADLSRNGFGPADALFAGVGACVLVAVWGAGFGLW